MPAYQIGLGLILLLGIVFGCGVMFAIMFMGRTILHQHRYDHELLDNMRMLFKRPTMFIPDIIDAVSRMRDDLETEEKMNVGQSMKLLRVITFLERLVHDHRIIPDVRDEIPLERQAVRLIHDAKYGV